MNILTGILMHPVDIIPGLADVLLAFVADWGILPVTGFITALYFASSAITYSDIPEEMLASARRWHGKFNEKFVNIDNLVNMIQGHSWGTPPPEFAQIVANRNRLSELITKCSSKRASSVDRGERNMLLKTTTGLCLGQMKIWACAQYYAKIMTINDVHSLGFLMPGESGGRHSRAKATTAVAEVKVTVLSADVIKVVINRSASGNAALVKHGWPAGVRFAEIVVISADGKTEVVRMHTTRLYNKIKIPEDSHGKLFIIMAAFLRHLTDKPLFGPQQTFSMPFTTSDLKRLSNDELKQYILEIEDRNLEIERKNLEIERQRREIEHLRAMLEISS
jgi:hypothetical protein